MNRNKRGVGLFELLVVTVIVFQLLSFAYVSYNDYVSQSKAVELKAFMSELMLDSMMYFVDNKSYSNLCDSMVTNVNYEINCSNNQDSFEITATNTLFTYGFNEKKEMWTSSAPKNWQTNEFCWSSRKNGDC